MANNFLSNVSATANAVSPFITNLILQGKQRKRDEKRRAEDFLRSDKIRAEDLEAKLTREARDEEIRNQNFRRQAAVQGRLSLEQEQEVFEGAGIEQQEEELPPGLAEFINRARAARLPAGAMTQLAEEGQVPGIEQSKSSLLSQQKTEAQIRDFKSKDELRQNLIKSRNIINELKQAASTTKGKTQRVKVLSDLERSLGRERKILNDPFMSALMDPVDLKQQLDDNTRAIEDVRVQQREIGEVEETPKAPPNSKQKVEIDLKTLLDLRDKTPKDSFGRMQGNMKKRIGALLTRGELSPEEGKALLMRLFL